MEPSEDENDDVMKTDDIDDSDDEMMTLKVVGEMIAELITE